MGQTHVCLFAYLFTTLLCSPLLMISELSLLATDVVWFGCHQQGPHLELLLWHRGFKLPPVTPLFHKSTDSSPGCPTSFPAARKAAKRWPNGLGPWHLPTWETFLEFWDPGFSLIHPSHWCHLRSGPTNERCLSPSKLFQINKEISGCFVFKLPFSYRCTIDQLHIAKFSKLP